MPFFLDDRSNAYQPVAVGIVEQTVLEATNIKGLDYYLIVITNMSLTETFSGTVSSSPNGVTQWTDEASDEFVSMGPGVSRRYKVPGDRMWVRVKGNFGAAPDTIRLTTVTAKEAIRRG